MKGRKLPHFEPTLLRTRHSVQVRASLAPLTRRRTMSAAAARRVDRLQSGPTTLLFREVVGPRIQGSIGVELGNRCSHHKLSGDSCAIGGVPKERHPRCAHSNWRPSRSRLTGDHLTRHSHPFCALVPHLFAVLGARRATTFGPPGRLGRLACPSRIAAGLALRRCPAEAKHSREPRTDVKEPTS